MDQKLLDFIIQTVKLFYADQKVKVFLYGSRARGENSERSDWDLAIDAPSEVSEFMLTIKEDSPTLCGVDIVFIPTATQELKEVISKEGKLIYEQ